VLISEKGQPFGCPFLFNDGGSVQGYFGVCSAMLVYLLVIVDRLALFSGCVVNVILTNNRPRFKCILETWTILEPRTTCSGGIYRNLIDEI